MTPTIVTKEGKPFLGISVAMGDLQDQTTLNCLLNVIEFGMPPEQAVTAPRFGTRHQEDSFQPSKAGIPVELGGLTLHEDIPEAVRENLAMRGHKIGTTGGAIAHPVMIEIDPETGEFLAAGDHRAGRHVGVLEPRNPGPAAAP